MDSVDLAALDFLVGAIAAVGVEDEAGCLRSSSIGLGSEIVLSLRCGQCLSASPDKLHSWASASPTAQGSETQSDPGRIGKSDIGVGRCLFRDPVSTLSAANRSSSVLGLCINILARDVPSI